MNLNQIVNMVMRIFVRKGVNWGINKGTDVVARRGKSPAQMTHADHVQAGQARDMVKRARKAARITRRIGH